MPLHVTVSVTVGVSAYHPWSVAGVPAAGERGAGERHSGDGADDRDERGNLDCCLHPIHLPGHGPTLSYTG
jgi:hypothetical protein